MLHAYIVNMLAEHLAFFPFSENGQLKKMWSTLLILVTLIHWVVVSSIITWPGTRCYPVAYLLLADCYSSGNHSYSWITIKCDEYNRSPFSSACPYWNAKNYTLR